MINSTFSSDNLIHLISYPFQDPSWKKKLLIGSLLILFSPLLLLVPEIFMIGYCGHILRRMAGEGGQPYLPEWDDWGSLFMEGQRILGVRVVAAIPILVFILPAVFLIYGSAMIPAIFSSPSSTNTPAALMFIPLIGSLAGLLLALIGMVVSLVYTLVMPAILSHVVVHQSFARAFKVSEWWAIWRANMGGYLMCLLVVWGFGFGLGLIYQALNLLVLVCFPLFFAMIAFSAFYLNLILLPLYAQVYCDGVQKLAEKRAEKASLAQDKG